MGVLRFDGEFPVVSQHEWLKMVEVVLKGADFGKVLTSKTYDDIFIEPLYQGIKDVVADGRRTGAHPWDVYQRIDLSDISAANLQLKEDIEGGATGCVIVTNDAPTARGFGLSLKTENDIAQLLRGVDAHNIRIEAGAQALHVASLLSAQSNVEIAFDPVGLKARGVEINPDTAVSDAIAFQDKAAKPIKLFMADGRPYHEAGASEAEELASVLATALHYLRAFEKHGMKPETARSSISFMLVADADEFMTIAKFRALRRLWKHIEEACGLVPQPINIHSETAWRMMTRYDPWTNLLRTTTAVFSAGVGGCDTLSVLPFTNALGLPDNMARRMARNIQHVLINESNLWRVIDPAAGAGSFETLTASLCEKAWQIFQNLEKQGGILAALKAGTWQNEISKTAQKRQYDFAIKKQKITGVSEFPDITADQVSVLAPIPTEAPLSLKGDALLSIRDAQAYETIRDRLEERKAKTGEREKVFIAALGPQAAYAGRAGFARNFFEVAGFETVLPEQELTPDNITALVNDSKAKIICLASSDAVYGEKAGAIASALETASGKKCYLVCSKELMPEWNIGTGIEAITPKSNALSILDHAVKHALTTV